MIKNSDMISGRFAAWARYRRAERFVRENAAAGRTVYLQNPGYCSVVKITKKTADCIVAKKSGLYMLSGRAKPRLTCLMDRGMPCHITAQ